MTAPGLTRRQFAAEIGRSVGYVQKLVDTGRCILTADGKIDGPSSRARIAETQVLVHRLPAHRNRTRKRLARKRRQALSVHLAEHEQLVEHIPRRQRRWRVHVQLPASLMHRPDSSLRRRAHVSPPNTR
jgi:hypothetical protein